MTANPSVQVDLTAAAASLTAAAVEAARVMKETEEFLEGIGLGISKKLTTGEWKRYKGDGPWVPGEEIHVAHEWLSFRPDLGGFFVTMETEITTDGDLTEELEIAVTPWEDTDQETQLRSFSALPALLKALVDEATRISKKTKKTAADVAALRAAA